MSQITNKAASQMLADLAQELFLNETKRFAVGNLTARFEATANAHRYDSTIQQVSRVISAMATRNPGQQISGTEIAGLMNKFYTPDTNFRSEFADLLETNAESEAKQAQANQAKRMNYMGDYRQLEEVRASVAEVDEINVQLDNESVEGLIDPSVVYSKLDEPAIRYAAALINEELRATRRIGNNSLKLKYKTPEILVYQANFKTASGEAQVFVPVELKDGNPLIPQVITTTEKVYSLDTAGIDSLTEDLAYGTYIKEAQSAQRLRVDLGLSDEVRDDNIGTVEVDEFEDLPQKEAHLGIDEIDSVLRNSIARKESRYASETVDYGRDLVAIELNDLGYRNPQVGYVSDYDHGLLYKATINTELGKFDITVPVEASKGALLNPHQFEAAGEVHDLTAASLGYAVKRSNVREDIHPMLYSMSYPDLKKQLKNAAYQHKPKLAKAVLALIAEKFDSYYQNAAIDDYQTWLEESSSDYAARCGGCDHYSEKSANSADWCNLVKTATRNVNKDHEAGICTRSIFAFEEEQEKIAFDDGSSIKI